LQYHKFRAWRTIKIYVAGLWWYYANIINDEDFASKIPYPKEEQDLPIVISRNELKKLFDYYEPPAYQKPKTILVIELLKLIHNVEVEKCKHWGGRMIVIESKDRPRAKSRASPLINVAL
jgi:hypothetical protein